MTGQALLLQADAGRLPLADASVDLIITSPPYYNLRAYTDNGTSYPGQLGGEPHWRDYLTALVAATAEMTRVLKPTGSIFVNLGDKYATAASGQAGSCGLESTNQGARQHGRGRPAPDARDKSLLLLPERYRIACTDQLGLIARAVLVWDKPNALPESVNDRVRHDHEDWVHLVKQPRYYSAVDELRQPQTSKPTDKGANCLAGQRSLKPVGPNSGAYNPLGALPGSVWTIPSEPLRIPDRLGVQHYAAFPSEWPRRLILGWSPPGICLACGHGRWPVVDHNGRLGGDNNPASRDGTRCRSTLDGGAREWTQHLQHPDQIRGYACSCTPSRWLPANGTAHRRQAWAYHLDGWTPPPVRPAVVLDPFCGTGTVPMVARALGRLGIGADLSSDYLRLAHWRVFQSGHAARATARTNAERQGALTLFTSEVTG